MESVEGVGHRCAAMAGGSVVRRRSLARGVAKEAFADYVAYTCTGDGISSHRITRTAVVVCTSMITWFTCSLLCISRGVFSRSGAVGCAMLFDYLAVLVPRDVIYIQIKQMTNPTDNYLLLILILYTSATDNTQQRGGSISRAPVPYASVEHQHLTWISIFGAKARRSQQQHPAPGAIPHARRPVQGTQ